MSKIQQVSSARAQIDKDLKQHHWALFSTILIGLIVLILVPIGATSLTGAHDLFPFIHQSYEAWQVTYYLGVAILAVLWAFGLRHRLRDISSCKLRKNFVIRQDRRIAEKLARLQAEQPVRERQARVVSVRDASSWVKKPTPGTKFSV